MLKFILIFSLLFTGSVGKTQPNQSMPTISNTMNKQFNILIEDFHFEGKNYRIFVAAPRQKTTSKYKVLYLLDGNAQFPLAVNLQNLDKNLPLIVGIGYPSDKAYPIAERTRDYTPFADGKAFEQGGGAANFLRFITQKVKPYIAQHYDIDLNEQHFFGHSFGGLFGLYVLFNQPDIFQHYTIASPSLWWGNGVIVPKTAIKLKIKPSYLQIILGEYEENPERNPNITLERLTRIKERQGVFSTRQFAELLQKQGIEPHFQIIKQKDHGDVIEEAIKKAIEHIQQ